jgi:hypothetical protein
VVGFGDIDISQHTSRRWRRSTSRSPEGRGRRAQPAREDRSPDAVEQQRLATPDHPRLDRPVAAREDQSTASVCFPRQQQRRRRIRGTCCPAGRD